MSALRIRSSLALCAFVLGLFCQPVLSQESKPQPVARLITSRSSVSAKPVTAVPVEPNEVEKRAFDQTNLMRVRNGLTPFVWDADVCRMARVHSQSMARESFFAHVTPSGLRLRDRARVAGILQFSVLGENIAYNQGYEDPGAFAVERWMESPKHRANILSPEFRAMAVGSFVGPDGSVYLTQTFITR
jgi:uncharacterized protein YkwD